MHYGSVYLTNYRTQRRKASGNVSTHAQQVADCQTHYLFLLVTYLLTYQQTKTTTRPANTDQYGNAVKYKKCQLKPDILTKDLQILAFTAKTYMKYYSNSAN